MTEISLTERLQQITQQREEQKRQRISQVASGLEQLTKLAEERERVMASDEHLNWMVKTGQMREEDANRLRAVPLEDRVRQTQEVLGHERRIAEREEEIETKRIQLEHHGIDPDKNENLLRLPQPQFNARLNEMVKDRQVETNVNRVSYSLNTLYGVSQPQAYDEINMMSDIFFSGDRRYAKEQAMEFVDEFYRTQSELQQAEIEAMREGVDKALQQFNQLPLVRDYNKMASEFESEREAFRYMRQEGLWNVLYDEHGNQEIRFKFQGVSYIHRDGRMFNAATEEEIPRRTFIPTRDREMLAKEETEQDAVARKVWERFDATYERQEDLRATIQKLHYNGQKINNLYHSIIAGERTVPPTAGAVTDPSIQEEQLTRKIDQINAEAMSPREKVRRISNLIRQMKTSADDYPQDGTVEPDSLQQRAAEADSLFNLLGAF
jgi:hypothetical protein